MPIKIKILLSFLGLFALFSVLALVSSSKGLLSLPSSPKLLTGTILEAVESDADHDGLTNTEESLWNTDFQNPDTDGDGYLDGEEVASSHDPLKPGPDDLLLTGETINVTDKVSTLLVSGFYAGDLSGSADPDIYNKALADISDAMIIDGLEALDPTNIPVGQIISSSDSKTAQETYLENIGSIIQNDLWSWLINEPRVAATKFANYNTEDPQLVADSQKYFNTRSIYYKEIINKLNTVPVPPSWFDIQRHILTTLQNLAISHQALGQTIDDPMKGLIAMNNLMSTYQDLQPFLVTIIQKIKNSNLAPPNGGLWDLVNALTDGF